MSSLVMSISSAYPFPCDQMVSERTGEKRKESWDHNMCPVSKCARIASSDEVLFRTEARDNRMTVQKLLNPPTNNGGESSISTAVQALSFPTVSYALPLASTTTTILFPEKLPIPLSNISTSKETGSSTNDSKTPLLKSETDDNAATVNSTFTTSCKDNILSLENLSPILCPLPVSVSLPFLRGFAHKKFYGPIPVSFPIQFPFSPLFSSSKSVPHFDEGTSLKSEDRGNYWYHGDSSLCNNKTRMEPMKKSTFLQPKPTSFPISSSFDTTSISKPAFVPSYSSLRFPLAVKSVDIPVKRPTRFPLIVQDSPSFRIPPRTINSSIKRKCAHSYNQGQFPMKTNSSLCKQKPIFSTSDLKSLLPTSSALPPSSKADNSTTLNALAAVAVCLLSSSIPENSSIFETKNSLRNF